MILIDPHAARLLSIAARRMATEILGSREHVRMPVTRAARSLVTASEELALEGDRRRQAVVIVNGSAHDGDRDRHGAPEMLTLDDVATALRCSVRTVQRRIAEGQLRAHRIGRHVRISVADLEDFQERNR